MMPPPPCECELLSSILAQKQESLTMMWTIDIPVCSACCSCKGYRGSFPHWAFSMTRAQTQDRLNEPSILAIELSRYLFKEMVLYILQHE